MAINVSPTDPLYYAHLFKVNASLIASAKAAGLSIHHAMGALKVQDASGKVFGTASAKGSALTLAKNGNLGPSSQAVINHQLSLGLTAGVTAHGGAVEAETPKTIDTSGMSAGQKAAVTKALKAGQVELVPLTTLMAKPKIHKPAQQLVNEKKLDDATTLYENVAGSSSVYKVVALYPDLKIAARRTSSQLSLRVAGTGLSKYLKKLGSLGFDNHTDYASVHLLVGDTELTQKTVGALFGLLGFANATALGDPLMLPVTA